MAGADLGVEWGAKYTLTGPDGTVVVFNDSTDANYIGILSPESSGLDSADVREEAADRVEADGGIHGAFYDGRRPVVLQGTIIASSKLQRNERVGKLKRATHALRGDAILKWKPEGASEEVQLRLRRQQPLRITKGYVKDFQAALVSADAHTYGVTTNSASKKGAAPKTLLLTTSSVANTENIVIGNALTTQTGSAWTNPENAKVNDSVAAVRSVASGGGRANTLQAVISAAGVPATAKVSKITGQVKRKRNANGTLGSTQMGIKYASGKYRTLKESAEAGPALTEAYAIESFSYAPAVPILGSELSLELFYAGIITSAFEGAGYPRVVEVDWMGLEVEYVEQLEFTVTNNGATAVAPKIKVTGPISNFDLINTTTGEKLSYTGSIAAGHYVEFDMENHTARLDGTTSVYGSVVFPAYWPTLAVGANVFTVAASGTTTATEFLVTWQNGWE